MNFHAKSGLCSSRNERVMLNFAIWQPFCFFKFFQKLVSYAQFFYLAAILFFKILSKFVQIVHTNFHAKSGVCCSKNERVMALGTKEDKHLSIIYIQAIIQSKLHFLYSWRKNPKKWIFAPAMSTSYLFLCDTYNRTETLVYIFKIESFIKF